LFSGILAGPFALHDAVAGAVQGLIAGVLVDILLIATGWTLKKTFIGGDLFITLLLPSPALVGGLGCGRVLRRLAFQLGYLLLPVFLESACSRTLRKNATSAKGEFLGHFNTPCAQTFPGQARVGRLQLVGNDY
jgi:hypothetical protein